MPKRLSRLVGKMVRAETVDLRDGEERCAVYVYLPNCRRMWVENYENLEKAERAAERFRVVLAVVVNVALKEVQK